MCYDGEGYDGEGYDGEGYNGEGYDGEGYGGEGYGGEGYDGEGYDGEAEITMSDPDNFGVHRHAYSQPRANHTAHFPVGVH